MSIADALLVALPGIPLVILLVTLLWMASVVRRDASLIDRFWGLGFVLLAWWYAIVAWAAGGVADKLLALLITLWGVRLSWHIARRNWGQGEDHRYVAMRQRNGAAWWWQSYATVFLLQGALMWFLSLLFAATLPAPGVTVVRWLAALVWAAGFAFETIGDRQLARFRADPANRGQVLDAGLWRWTRHPNYFGDALQWWGFWGFALANGSWWTIVCPALMTFLLVRVSGVALLERSLLASRPGYADYVRRTSAFLPRRPRDD